MMGSGRWLRAQPGRFANLFVVPMALGVVGLSLPKPLNLVLLVVAVAGLFLLTVASYTRGEPS